MTKEELILEQEQLKVDLLKKDIELRSLPTNNSPKIDGVTATILVALIGFLGTTIVSIINSISERELKQREFETELIKSALERPTHKQTIDLLAFINKLKLIKDKETSRSLDTALTDPESIPSLSSTEIVLGNSPIQVDSEFLTTNQPISLSALKAAEKYVGSSEDSNDYYLGKNISKFNRGGRNPFWSTSFICWCFSQNRNGRPPFKFVYTWMELEAELKSKNLYSSNISSIKKGDIIILKGQSNEIPHRGGIVEQINGSLVVGIFGNIGNKVVRKTVGLDQIRCLGKID